MYYYNIAKLCDLIKYDDEKVNKEVLLQNENKKMIIFTLKENQEIPTHKSETDAIIFVLKGEIEFTLCEKEEKYEIKENEIMKIKTFDKHFLKATKNTIFILVKI